MSALGLAAPGRGVGAAAGRHLPLLGLGLLGALRWSTLLSPGAGWRLIGLVLLGGVVMHLGRRARPVGLAALGLAGLGGAMLLSGWPLEWLLHLRLAVLARSLGAGLGALPRALVPYLGVNHDLRRVIVLGAGVLLLAAAVLEAAARESNGPGARARSAVPVLALAAIPVTLVRPALPMLEGGAILVLLGLHVWGDRLRAGETASAATALLLAASLAALPLASRLSANRSWIDPSSLAGSLAPAGLARFDWSQGYGPLSWSRQGRQVLAIAAPRGTLWKAENLDAFDGRGWVAAPSPQIGEPPLPASALRRWSEEIAVTVGSLASRQVIAAGSAAAPRGLPAVLPGTSPGTWLAFRGLGPGDSYRVLVYAPAPSAAALARIRSEPRSLLTDTRSLTLPAGSAPTAGSLTVSFAAYAGGRPAAGSTPSVAGLSPAQATTAVLASPYGGVFRLARRLAAGAGGPYAVARRILAHLGRGYRYDEHPRPAGLPLVTFLLSTHAGYCQHFAGAMALLLRMSGIPARVATGFTRGVLDAATHEWIVQDIDAHAWVEAWFPGSGWVSFDPTPGVAPELSGLVPLRGFAADAPRGHHGGGAVPAPRLAQGAARLPGRRAGTAGRPGESLPWWPLGLGLALLAFAWALLSRVVRLRPPAPEELVGELERARARCGRPLEPSTTLAQLARAWHEEPDAAAYVRRLAAARYGSSAFLPAPSAHERARVRAAVSRGSGPGSRLRGWWALPPRWVLLHSRGG